MSCDGAPVERLLDLPVRPLISVFLPERLELIKGPPALRRAHLDQLVAAALAGADRDPPRVLASARPAQRAAGSDPRRAQRPDGAVGLGQRAGGGGRWRCRPTAPVPSALLTEPFPARARSARPRGNAHPRVQAEVARRAARRSSSPSSPRAWTATSSAASPATAPIATSSRSCATAASCASTARRASSASRCSPCCSPSAPCSAPSGARRR